jgi:5-methyltetrahydropteroyltriglutamate--homocysteine methyltransferase
MVNSANLGYPRIGFKRELKTALEKFWSGQISEDELKNVGKDLRLSSWLFQSTSNLDYVPSNDFSFYDHVLDTIAMVGAVPKRFEWTGGEVDLKTYFLMARGIAKSPDSNGKHIEAPAMEMTKWFNTNYHFIVPEVEDDLKFTLASRKCVNEFLEAKDVGVLTRPVLLGPVTFLYLAKGHGEDERRLDQLLDVYCEVLSLLRNAGAEWIQVDEPCLSSDLNDKAVSAFRKVYERLSHEKLSIMLTTYFAPIGRNLDLSLKLPVQGLHVDLINGREDLEIVLKQLPEHMFLSAGVIDGHNVWRCNLEKTADLLEQIAAKIGLERLVIAPSCSLMHVPIDVNAENRITPEVKSWLAFAEQKVHEISVLADALSCGRTEVAQMLNDNLAFVKSASTSELRNNEAVKSRLAGISQAMSERDKPFSQRHALQQSKFELPLFPTTTIGSFPQTKEIRSARKQLRSRQISEGDYLEAMRAEIKNNISLQEKIGLDVLVHGEPERTDMVEYFAEMLDGMAVTQYGWVQSYGSRCVKPPIIYGNVARPQAITVEWAKFAQEQTAKPVKGMLTGPVTILQWSFVRDDQEREKTCMEIAFAIRDEVADLETAGIGIIQIDEPAIREGLPLKRSEWKEYIEWSTKCFRVASSSVKADTQIHTHMCYSEFGDMFEAIAAMDADVISIEASRSKMDLLDTLRDVEYPNAIGPGVYDIHSPRVPSEAEVEHLLRKALRVIPPTRLWVNPDCGLKTRNWSEVVPALNAMVQAAANLRRLALERVNLPPKVVKN